MNDKLRDKALCESIVFVGETLGPFYLEDPENQTIAPALEAISALDARQAGIAWPFVDNEQAACYLSLMQEGLGGGTASEDLIWEYRRLFIGPAKKSAPPWGSVYTDREGVVFGESTLNLHQWMREKGIARMRDEKTPEDHIGLMIILMAWIAENKPDLLEEYLQKHFFTWSSHFLKELTCATEQPFYKGLALLTQASLEGIQDFLDLTVDYPKYYR